MADRILEETLSALDEPPAVLARLGDEYAPIRNLVDQPARFEQLKTLSYGCSRQTELVAQFVFAGQTDVDADLTALDSMFEDGVELLVVGRG
jgi:hypothetical protein